MKRHHHGVFSIHQIEQILGDEPEVKERLFAVLKQYAAEKKVDWLASVLPDVLTTDEQRQLISNIRYRSTATVLLPRLFRYTPPKWVDTDSIPPVTGRGGDGSLQLPKREIR